VNVTRQEPGEYARGSFRTIMLGADSLVTLLGIMERDEPDFLEQDWSLRQTIIDQPRNCTELGALRNNIDRDKGNETRIMEGHAGNDARSSLGDNEG